MADRTSAGIFGKIFTLLADVTPEKHKELAQEFYEASREYDFSEYQMSCDEALIKLGLAKMGIDPDYPEDGEVILYNNH